MCLLAIAIMKMVEGTQGEAPDVTQVVSTVEEVAALVVPDPDKVAYLTQTTLSLDEARYMIEGAQGEVSEHHWATRAGYLLRDGESADRRQERGTRRGPGSCGWLQEQFELEPAGRGFEESGYELFPD